MADVNTKEAVEFLSAALKDADHIESRGVMVRASHLRALLLALDQSAQALGEAERERDEARALQRKLFERGVKVDGMQASAVWLERQAGANFLWLVWAIKPGTVRLIAVCSEEHIADRYADNLPPGLAGFKAWKERAPIDHSFGFTDSLHARAQGRL